MCVYVCVLTVGLVKGLSVVVLVASVFFDLVTILAASGP